MAVPLLLFRNRVHGSAHVLFSAPLNKQFHARSATLNQCLLMFTLGFFDEETIIANQVIPSLTVLTLNCG